MISDRPISESSHFDFDPLISFKLSYTQLHPDNPYETRVQPFPYQQPEKNPVTGMSEHRCQLILLKHHHEIIYVKNTIAIQIYMNWEYQHMYETILSSYI